MIFCLSFNLKEEMDEYRKRELSASNLTKIHELKTMTMEIESVYVEYTTVVHQVSHSMNMYMFVLQQLFFDASLS